MGPIQSPTPRGDASDKPSTFVCFQGGGPTIERSPIPLIALRAPAVRAEAYRLKARGVLDIKGHLQAHPEVLESLCEATSTEQVNEAALALLDVPSEDVLGTMLPSLMAAQWQDLHAEMATAFAEERTSLTTDMDVQTARGSTLHTRVTVGLPAPDGDGADQDALLVLAMVDLTRETGQRRLYRLLAEEVGTFTGARWLQEAVTFMRKRLDADLALIARLDEDGSTYHALSANLDGEPASHERELLTCPPCRRAVDDRVALYSEDLPPARPDDGIFGKVAARSVAVAPVLGAGGSVLGVVAAAFRSTVPDSDHVVSVLHLMAARATAELERASAEEQHAHLEAQLVHAQRLESVGRLAGGIAHDFNNLLAPILAYTEMAMEELPDDDEVRDDLEEVIRAAGRASRVTRKLLAFSRRQRLDVHPVDLGAVLHGFMHMIRTVIREDIRVELADTDEPIVIWGDEGQIEQVLMNLILNAQDAMPGGGHLTIRTRRRQVNHARNDLPPGSYVCLEIGDTGSGMDDETRALIFEPFFTTKEAHEGTGLGLAMVYGIMQQHGGTVEVESALGVGTTFRLYFRVSEEGAARESDGTSPSRASPGFERVLVVEDEAIVRRVVISILRRNGYEVVAASTPSEALEVGRDPSVPLDLLVTDVLMPQMTGVELHEAIHRTRPDLPVLYLSGYAPDVLEARGAAGVNLLEKPFSKEEFLERVRSILD